MSGKGKCSLLACHIRCKCSMETACNSMNVKLGIKVKILVENVMGLEVTVGKSSECHLIFVRWRLDIAEKIPVSTIELPE